jgi:hypothetical protein
MRDKVADMTTMPAEIIYDDDDIRVLYHPGASSYVLITFGDLLTVPDGAKFFAEAPVRKLGLTCVSFLVKNANWYAPASVTAAMPAVNARIGHFRERIIYGASMGGYGCIRHSAQLGATTVIALCPQWSVDPAQTEGRNPGWPQLFSERLRSHGTLPEQVAGDVYIFADQLDVVDKFQTELLLRIYPQAKVINVPMVEHHVTPVFAGTRNLESLIALCRAGDVKGLIRLSRAVRKDSPRRINACIQKGIDQMPRTVYKIMAARPQDDFSLVHLGGRHMARAVAYFGSISDRKAAISYIEAYRHELRDPQEIVRAGALLAHLKGRPARLLTFHNTALVFDHAQRRCTHAAAIDGGFRSPIFLRVEGLTLTLSTTLAGMEVALYINEAGHITDIASPALARFEVTPRANNNVNLNHEGRYLSTQPEGGVTCDRDTPFEWEAFWIG